MIESLPPRLAGAAIQQYSAVWIDELPENDHFLAQLKVDNAAAQGLRAAIMLWTDGAFAKASCFSTHAGARFYIDAEGAEMAYQIGRKALERRHAGGAV